MTQQQYSPYVISKNPSVQKMRIQKEEEGDKRYPIGRFDFRSIINFGSRTENCYEKVAAIENGGVILNHPENIKNASDKVRCKEILKSWFIPTPNYQLPDDIKIVGKDSVTGLKITFPMVAKLRRGSGGEGMTLINNTKDLVNWFGETKSSEVKNYFFEEVFQPDMKKNYEYRVSVSPLLLGKSMNYTGGIHTKLGEIIVLRKLIRQDAVDEGKFGRNIALGNSYFTKEFERSFNRKRKNGGHVIMKITDAVAIAVEACSACDLDFGAVDMIFDSESGNWTVLEINTAPSMGNEEQTFTVNRWIEALRVMLQEKKDLQ